MPYSGPDDPNLPDHVKRLTATRKRQWVAVFNGAYTACQREGGADCEGAAFRQANGVAAAEPSSGDLHVPQPLGKRDERPTRHFLTRLKALIRDKVKDGDLSDQDYAECVMKARGHAGGMARAEKRRAAPAEMAEHHSACIVALWLALADAEAIAVAGGEAADDLHITLCHLGESDPDVVARAMTVAGAFAAEHAPITGRVSGLGRFNATESSDGMDCVHALIDAPALPAFRQALVEALSEAGLAVSTTHGFSPHVTLAYVEPGADSPVESVEDRDLAFTTLWVCTGEDRTAFTLLGLTESETAEVEQYDEPSAVGRRPSGAEPAEALPAIYLGWVRLGEDVTAVEARDAQTCRLFLDAPAEFAEAPEWVPFLPKPGRYKHPRYGEIAFTPERIDRFVAQFNTGLYQTQLPLDIEHETKLGGAAGWIKELRKSTDGGADARVEWTDRGRALIEADRFKYVSPEFYDEWTDPATGAKHKDVAIGGAITTRPFFKEASLRPLAASEEESAGEPTAAAEWDTAMVNDLPDSAFLHVRPGGRKDDSGRTVPRDLRMFPYRGPGGDIDLPHLRNALARIPQAEISADLKSALTARAQRLLAGKTVSDRPGDKQAHEEGSPMADTDEMTDQARRLTELETTLREKERELAKAKAATEANQREATALSERIASIEASARTKRFTDEVMGRADGGLRWFGEPGYHLEMLETLSRQFGEDSSQVTAYINHARAVADALKQAGLFREIGRAGVESRNDNPASKLNALAHARAAERGLTFGEALSQVAAERPDLYEAYRTEALVRV